MIGALRLIMAVAFAAALSQFPAFSDQYLQRLGGQVDALTLVVAEFDASAANAGLTRDQALNDLSGSEFRAAHRDDLVRTFGRLDKARADLLILRAAEPLERMLLPHRLRDTETLTATWGDFRPAIPVTLSGALAALAGFVLGWIATGLAASPFRRRPDPVGWR